MTWSIIAKDSATGQIGIAVATKFFAVGALAPHVAAGKQSAALLIHEREEWLALDLRVDDHADPLAERERLERVSRERWVHFRRFLPTRERPAGITDRGTIDAGVEQALASGQ